MNRTLHTALGIAGLVVATQAAAQVTFYEREDFRGRSFTADHPIGNLERAGFNDRASSARVDGGAWQVCEDSRFSGNCVVLQPGQYDSLRAIGLNNAISSVRPVDRYSSNDRRDEPRYAQDAPRYDAPRIAGNADYDRGDANRPYEAPVTSVHAVVGPPEQRCWVERQDVAQDNHNVPGAVIGGVIGGILGHQVGAGRGNTAATIGGAVAGAAIGSNVNRGGDGVYSRDVQRCESARNDAAPAYWDVTYDFRGVEHHVQTSAPPGPTIPVDRNGDPRM
jgi:uncharacterized protein YcfJ